MTTIPNGSQYENIVNGYLGTDYTDAQAGFVTKKDVLWAKFLQESGLTAQDPLVLAQDPAVLAKFVTFVQKTYDSLQTNTLAPDEVRRRDLMFSVYDLVVLILQVLQRNVGVVGQNVVFLNKYAKEYATMMGRTAEAFYIGGALSLPQPNRADLSKWTLGYDSITMQEYLDAAVYRPDTYKINSLNTLYPPAGPDERQNGRAILTDPLTVVKQTEFIALGPLTRDTVSNAGPKDRNSLVFTSSATSITITYNYFQQYSRIAQYYRDEYNDKGEFVKRVDSAPVPYKGYYAIQPPPSVTVNYPPNATDKQKMDLAQSALQQLLDTHVNNDAAGAIFSGTDTQGGLPPPPPPPSGFYATAYSYSVLPAVQYMTVYQSTTQPVTYYGVSNTNPPDLTVIQNLTRQWDPKVNKVNIYTPDENERIYIGAASRYRGTNNSLLQQFVTNSQSKRQIVSNQADAAQSQMDSAQTGFNQGASLLKDYDRPAFYYINVNLPGFKVRNERMSTPIDLNFDGVIATQVDLSKPQAPTSGVYGALFQPLFGGLPPENQQEVWNYFLYKNNLQDPPPTTQQTQDIFKNYAIDVYKFLQRKILEENVVVNLPLLQPPTSGFYATAFQNYFGTISAQEKQQVWVQFLVNNDFTTTAPPTDALTETKFIQYAASVFGLDSTVSYNFSILEPPTTGFFANAFQSYFAGLSPLQQKKIWVQFLINNHFTVTGPTEDAATMQIFMAYANAVLSVIQNQDVHSPEEVKKRYIMSQTIEALLKMLGSLQDAIGVQSRNLIFYGKWQQEYTKMMARVPTYTGSPDMSVKVPPTLTPASMDSFTFGYNKISVSDIADWWAASSLDGKTQAFVMSSLGKDFFGQSIFSITFTPQSGANPGSISWTGSGGAGTIQIPLQNNILTFQDNPAQTKRDLAQDTYATAFKNAFINAWNGGVQSSLIAVNTQNYTAINAVQATATTTPTDMQPRSKPDTSAYSAMELPWGYSYVVPEASHTDGSGNVTVAGKLSDDNAKLRGEVNSKLQAMIDNIRSRRKTIQTTAQRLQSDLDQSRQTVTKQSDILNSVLQSITDLVKSIFRK